MSPAAVRWTSLSCRAKGVGDDYFIIQYLPIYVGEYVWAWLEFLSHDSIRDWADLKSYQQEPSESLRDYIRRFSK